MNEPTEESLEQQLRRALEASRQNGFAPGFEDRALARWKEERRAMAAPSTISLIEYRARRLLPFAVAASLVLAVYSASAGNSANGNHRANIVERALGWQNASESADASDLFESVYGLPQSKSNTGGR